MARPIRIEFGSSIIEAEHITQLAASSGLRVELLRNTNVDAGASDALGRAAILVTEADEAPLRALLEGFGY